MCVTMAFLINCKYLPWENVSVRACVCLPRVLLKRMKMVLESTYGTQHKGNTRKTKEGHLLRADPGLERNIVP